MKYLVRAIKYFFTLILVLTLLILALVAFKVVDGDPANLFVNGYDSYWQIALMLAAMSALYPKLGYTTRCVRVPGVPEETEGGVMEVMQAHGYALEGRDGDILRFRKSSPVSRALKLWEDRITMTRTLAGFEMEGLTRDLPRLVAALEARFIP